MNNSAKFFGNFEPKKLPTELLTPETYAMLEQQTRHLWELLIEPAKTISPTWWSGAYLVMARAIKDAYKLSDPVHGQEYADFLAKEIMRPIDE